MAVYQFERSFCRGGFSRRRNPPAPFRRMAEAVAEVLDEGNVPESISPDPPKLVTNSP
jgi:hypothetical protein